MPSRRVRVFVNERSGGGDLDPAQLIELFRQHGCACEVTQLHPALDLQSLARTDPPDVSFVAAGGDGTVNCVANVVAGTGRCMGVLPAGTLNHFARDLGLPPELPDAVRVVAGAVTRRVDAGTVNGQVFVNNSSLGAYPLMVLDRERMKRTGWNKWVSLATASARSFFQLLQVWVEVEVDGRTQVCRTPYVFLGNNEYCVEGTRIGHRERLDAGVLSVYFARGIGRWGVVKMAVAALFGRVRELREHEELKGRRVTLRLHRRNPRVALDGEVRRMRAPLEYRILPGALQVHCPAETADE